MDDDVTPPGKGSADTHRARRAFTKSMDASRAVAEAAEAVTANVTSTGIPIGPLDEEDSLIIYIEDVMNMQSNRTPTPAPMPKPLRLVRGKTQR